MAKNNYKRSDWAHIAFHKKISQEIQEELLQKFNDGIIKTERLTTNDGSIAYAIKVSKGGRLICTSKKAAKPGSKNNKDCLIVLYEDLGHKFDFEKKAFNIVKLDESISGIKSEDAFVFYSKEQNEVAKSVDRLDFQSHGIEYFGINGLAGSGKTTMAFDVLRGASEKGLDSIYLSKSPRLVESAKKILSDDGYESDSTENKADGESKDHTEDHPTQFVTYDQLVSDQLIDKNLKNYMKVADSGFETFKLFISKNFKTLSIPPEALYLEVQKSSIGIGKKGSLYPEIHRTEANKQTLAEEVASQYVEYLGQNKIIDPTFVSSQIENQRPMHDSRKVVVIDESQNFTPLEIQNVLSHYPNATFYLCRDGNQSLSDPFDHVMQSMYAISGRVPEAIFDLNISYRTPPAITDLANRLLDAKAKIIGGKLNKIDALEASYSQTKDETFRSAVDDSGYVKIMDDISAQENAKTIDQLKEDAQNIIETVVIAFSDEQKAQARQLLGQDAMVLLPNEVVGLEYKKIILFNPFSGDSLLSDDKIFESRYEARSEAPTNYPKNSAYIKYAIPLNELFVAITRSTSDLYVLNIDGQNTGRGQFFPKLFDSIITQYSDAEASRISEMTLEGLIKYIEETKSILTDEVLTQYVVRAIQMLDNEDMTKEERKPSAEQLSSILRYNKLEVSKEIHTILEDILSTELAAASEAQEAGFAASDASADSPAEPGENAHSSSTAKNRKNKNKNKKKKKKNANKEKSDSADGDDSHQIKTSLNEKLIEAANNGEIAQVEKLIKEGADVNAKDKDGNPALHSAAVHGYGEIAQSLIKANANVNIQNRCENTALLIAAMYGHEKIVSHLLNEKAEVNTPNDNGLTALHVAATYGHDKIAQSLIKAGADINAQNVFGNTALMVASAKGLTETVKILLKAGADHNITNKAKKTAMKFAAEKNHRDIVEILVKEIKKIKEAEEIKTEALLQAAENGNVEEVKKLLDEKVDLNTKDHNGNTALHLASSNKQTPVAQLLLDKGADINAQNRFGNTALHIASCKDHAEVVKLLLNTKADVNAQNKNGFTALHLASSNKQTPVAQLLLDKGADINAQNSFGNTALHAAADWGREDMLQILINANADVDAQNKDRNTALHLASLHNRTEAVRILLKTKANLNLTNSYQKTALTIAEEMGHSEIVKIIAEEVSKAIKELLVATWEGNFAEVEKLIKKGADVNAKDDNGYTALHAASCQGHTKIAKLLLANNADAKAKSPGVDTPLRIASIAGHTEIEELLKDQRTEPNLGHAEAIKTEALLQAAKNGNVEEVNKLLDEGIDVNAKDNDGNTALHVSSCLGHVGVVKLLIEKNANVNAQNKDGFTALHLASSNEQTEMARLLLDKGADINAQNKLGNTALHIASSNGQKEMARLLLDKGADINLINADKSKASTLALNNNHTSTAEIIVDEMENKALLEAARHGKLAHAQKIFKEAAKVNAKYTYDTLLELGEVAEGNILPQDNESEVVPLLGIDG